MKFVLITLLFIFSKNSFSSAKDINPCAKDGQSRECKNFISNLQLENPCMKDIELFCLNKEAVNVQDTKQVNNINFSACIEKNFLKFSSQCQESLNKKKAKQSCMNQAMSKCAKLPKDQEIDCLADEQAEAFNKCQNL